MLPIDEGAKYFITIHIRAILFNKNVSEVLCVNNLYSFLFNSSFLEKIYFAI